MSWLQQLQTRTLSESALDQTTRFSYDFEGLRPYYDYELGSTLRDYTVCPERLHKI